MISPHRTILQTDIPVEIWMMILEQIPRWEFNVLLFLKLSHICRSARKVFTSDMAWKFLNPYGTKSNIVDNFWLHLSSLEPKEQQAIRIVWEAARKSLTPRGSNELYYMVLKQELPTLKSSRSLFYDLGFLLGTAYSYTRKDTKIRNFATNEQVIRCAVNICPICIHHVDHTQLGNETALQAAKVLMPMSQIFDTRVKSVTASMAEASMTIDIQLSSRLRPENIKLNDSDPDSEFLSQYQDQLASVTRHDESDSSLRYSLVTKCGEILTLEKYATNTKITLPVNVFLDRTFCLAAFLNGREKNSSQGYYYDHPAIRANLVEFVDKVWDDTLRDDTILVERFVRWCGLGLKLASARLRANRDIVSAAFQEDGMSAPYSCASFLCDKELALKAVGSNGLALQYFPKFHTDMDVVYTAIRQSGEAYKYASKLLQSIAQVARLAVSSFPAAIQYAPETIRNDFATADMALFIDGLALQFLSQEIMNTKELVLTAVNQNGWALKYASAELKGDASIVFAAVSNCGMALQFASMELRSNNALVRKAVLDDHRAILHASPTLSANLGSVDWHMAKAVNAPRTRGRQAKTIVI